MSAQNGHVKTNTDKTHDNVKEYYGQTLQKSSDLASNACTLGKEGMPKHIRQIRATVHDDVVAKAFGCGLTIPEGLSGCRIADLGSGGGVDVYVLSKLVGQDGEVTGVDMTDELLEFSRSHIDYHTKEFGYSRPNVSFVKGFIEKLTDAGLKENYYDIIVSNCVVCLTSNKRSTLREAYKILKEGGEFYFSDMYVNRPQNPALKDNPLLWGEGFAGSLYWRELFTLAKEAGFSTPRLVKSGNITIGNPEIEKAVDGAKYISATYRLFKLPEKRLPASELTYNGGVEYVDGDLKFDIRATFQIGKPFVADSELATAVMSSRLAQYFTCKPLETSLTVDPVENAKGTGAGYIK